MHIEMHIEIRLIYYCNGVSTDEAFPRNSLIKPDMPSGEAKDLFSFIEGAFARINQYLRTNWNARQAVACPNLQIVNFLSLRSTPQLIRTVFAS
jgi:hypothetical protein